MNGKHPLHEDIGDIIFTVLTAKGYTVLMDTACQKIKKAANIPFFLKDQMGNDTEITNVDILVLDQNDKTVLVCEIEESDLKPNHLLGKLASVALAFGYKSNSKKISIIPKTECFYFLHVLSEDKLNTGSKKTDQWSYIEMAVNLSCDFRRILDYKIISGKQNDFKPGNKARKNLDDYLKQL